MKQFIPAGLGVASILAIITCSAVHVSSCKNAPASDTTAVRALAIGHHPVIVIPYNDSGTNTGGSGIGPKVVLRCEHEDCNLLAVSTVTSGIPSPETDYAVEVKALQDIPANSTFRLEFRIVKDTSNPKADSTPKK